MPTAGVVLRRKPVRAALVATVVGISAAAGLWTADRLLPPPLDRLADVSTVVLDRDGRALRIFLNNTGAWRLPASVADVEPLYIELLLEREDRRFYRHRGVDPLAVARAAYQNLKAGRIVSGASTLTMQVARLLDPKPRTPSAKLVEALRALQLEWRYDKDAILGMYLTLAPFGGNLEGVRAGARAWLGKEPRELTAAEAALLVALPQAPSRLRPDRRPRAAREARDRVLQQGRAASLLNVTAIAEAAAEEVPTRRLAWPLLAPHLAEHLKRQHPAAILIRTTVDGSLQRVLEDLVANEALSLPAPNSLALLVVDNKTATIAAAVGSADYGDAGRLGAIDMTRAVRSPGSTLKPFVYGLAFDAGILRPRTLIADVSMRFGDYAPKNFDQAFHGELTAAEALQRSLNVPAVLILDRLGPARVAAALERSGAGLHFPKAATDAGVRSSPGLPLALGGVGTTLEDVTMLYAGLARGGLVRPLRATLDTPEPTPVRLMSATAATDVLAILAEAAPPPGVVPAAARMGRGAIALKTGTSYGFRDAWAFGVTREFTVGVWAGRPDGTPSPDRLGRDAAAPVLQKVFDLLPAMTAPGGPSSGDDRPPVLLRRLESAPAAGEGIRIQDPHRLRLIFPIARSTIQRDGERTPVSLVATGGRRPLSWLIDGRPIAADRAAREAEWLPQQTGEVRITVLDADGRSDSALIEVR
jgi:penicillin-binding protein 1C